MMPDGSPPRTPRQGFQPAVDTQRMFRDGLGRFATGVTVVTVAAPDGMIGMTANSFSSVSMDPPLVLWCPATGSGRYQYFETARHFAIHVLSADQEDLALAFARSGSAFDGLDVVQNENGVPIFVNCLARFVCDTYAMHDAGDHAIMVGQVRSAVYRDGEPLIFSQGQFRRFDNQA